MRAIIIALALGGGLAANAAAQELTIKPGNWEMTTEMVMSMNMNGQAMNIPPRTMTETECRSADDATFSPDALVQEGCTVSNVEGTDRSLSFDVVCTQQGMNMNGSMAFQLDASGNNGTGQIEMNGSVPGGTVSMTGTSTATYKGAC